MKKVKTYLFWALILIGFIIRCFSISYNGIFDIGTYNDWGLNTLQNGLHISYNGIYFPFQYQIFEFCTLISKLLGIDYFIVFKSINLIFDCGNLIVLYFILQQFKVSKLYVLTYWLHPWFLNMFSLGYCDFQFTFFILCSLYFTIKNSSRNYLISGFFLGFAFLMKPQVQIVFLSFFIYSVFNYFKTKDLRIFLIFIFPTIFFINYFLYFLIIDGNPSRLVMTYLHVANAMPCLNANFLNGWFPVAYLLKGPTDPIYSVTDKLTSSGIYWRSIAIAIVLILIFYFIRLLISKNSKGENSLNLYLIACFSSFVVPFVMTSAHENHLFLATVLLIPVLAKTSNILVKVCFHLILVLQFVNLYGYYGIGDIKPIIFLNYSYTYNHAVVLSVIASLLFLITLFYFFRRKSDFTEQLT